MDAKTIRLVLLGGGHTNTQVIQHIGAWNMPPNIQLTLVSDYESSLYSGMCPGGVAQQYQEAEFSVDLVECCNALQWQFVCKKITEIDDAKQELVAADGSRIGYDILSVDIGSTNVGLAECEGVTQYAISTRPLKLLMDKLNKSETQLLQRLKTQKQQQQQQQLDIVCVGGGCAGCELLMGVTHRLQHRMREMEIDGVDIRSTLITNAKQILSNDPAALQAAVLQCMKQKNLHIITRQKVVKLDKDRLYLLDSDGSHTQLGQRRYDVCIWATGAAPHQLQTHNIARHANGWLSVNSHLQSTSHENIFGAGDCVHLVDHPQTPKSGVYAVREGPILIHNLQQYAIFVFSWVAQGKNTPTAQLKTYVPQSDFLRLLNCGDGTGIGCKHGIAFQGAWVWQMKHWIDSAWMKKFDVAALLKNKTDQQQDFKPQITAATQEQKQQEDLEYEHAVQNAVSVLMLNDTPEKCEGFAQQWSILLKMNDDKGFCNDVVTMYKQSI